MRTLLATAAGFTILAIGALTVSGSLDSDPTCNFSVAHDVCVAQP